MSLACSVFVVRCSLPPVPRERERKTKNKENEKDKQQETADVFRRQRSWSKRKPSENQGLPPQTAPMTCLSLRTQSASSVGNVWGPRQRQEAPREGARVRAQGLNTVSNLHSPTRRAHGRDDGVVPRRHFGELMVLHAGAIEEQRMPHMGRRWPSLGVPTMLCMCRGADQRARVVVYDRAHAAVTT